MLLRVLTWDAILNSSSVRALATGGRLSRTAPLMTLVHSAPLSAAVTGKVCTNKDIPERKWVCKIYISLQLHVLERLKMLWAGGIFYFIIVNNIIGLLKLPYYNQIIFPQLQ